jgi:ribosome-binding protein aMBF1 (putative translation factor)
MPPQNLNFGIEHPVLGYSKTGCRIRLMLRNSRYGTFQRALIEARQTNNLTQSDVACRLGKPQSYVSKYESGERRLDVIEFVEVCAALNIKPIEILERLDNDER